MKVFVYLTLATGLFLAASCNSGNSGGSAGSQVKVDSSKGATMTFDKEIHNFGDVEEGEVVEHSFRFTNTGGKSLVIVNAQASCGCTVPQWPKEPIQPGESGYITVKFDSKGRPEGFTEKEIFIQANTEPPMTHGPRIQCVIVAKK
ncbi:DUF1573 domain-containing protein [Chitinophaga lutea]